MEHSINMTKITSVLIFLLTLVIQYSSSLSSEDPLATNLIGDLIGKRLNNVIDDIIANISILNLAVEELEKKDIDTDLKLAELNSSGKGHLTTQLIN